MSKKMLPRKPMKMDESPRVRERMIRQEEDLTMVKPIEKQADAPMKNAKMEDDSIAEDWIISGVPEGQISRQTTKDTDNAPEVVLNVPARSEDTDNVPSEPSGTDIKEDPIVEDTAETKPPEEPAPEEEPTENNGQRPNLVTAAMSAIQVDGFANKMKGLWAEAKKQTKLIRSKKHQNKDTAQDQSETQTEKTDDAEDEIRGVEKDPESHSDAKPGDIPDPTPTDGPEAGADTGSGADARSDADTRAEAGQKTRTRTRTRTGSGGLLGAIGASRTRKGKKEPREDTEPKKSASERARDKAIEDYQLILDGKVNPNSFKGKMIRKRMRAAGYVYLYTLDYVLESDRYVRRLDMVKKSDLPQDAHHMTGEDGYYGYDVNGVVFDSQRENGFTQISAYNYMHNHKIEDAFSYKWMSKREGGNKKFLALIVAIGIGIVIYVAYIFMH